MLTTILSKIIIALIILILLILITGRRIFQYKAYIGIFFLLYFADNLLIVYSIQYRSLQLIPLHTWEGFLNSNWSGKLYSIIFTLGLLYFTRRLLTFEEAGITLRQRPGSIFPSLIVVLALAGWATVIGINSPKGSFDAETLLYLAIMPGLNEELVYRGGLLGSLNRILPGRINFLGARLGWGTLVISVLFGLLHGFWLDNTYSVHMDIIALENSFVSGFIFAWLKERTGSLVVPIIAHGLEDFLFFLPRMI